MSNNDPMHLWNIIKIKADLLCFGIHRTRSAEEIYKSQNPNEDWKTGNVGIHIILENGSHVLVTVSHSFDQNSPYHIENFSENFCLFRNDQKILPIKIVSMPRWYSRKTTTGKEMPKIFLHEGRAYIHQAYRGCDFHRIGLPCKFCGTGRDWDIGTPVEVAETVNEAFTTNQDYQVCLGGGTRLPLENNVKYFLACITEIRKRVPNVPIWVEMVPPENDDIVKLVDAGATSFGFNIEIWNETLCQQICPSKFGTSKYLSAMEKALALVGPNRVGSCLIAGVQPTEEATEGAIRLAAMGVQPCIVPFKPWDKSVFQNRSPCMPYELIEISKTAAKAMIDNGISPKKNQGCLNCESCTIDSDIFSLQRQYPQN